MDHAKKIKTNIKSTPIVSVITVCYNAVNTLEHTIKSVIQQSYPKIEYIIIDGCSNDGTVEIITKYDNYISKWLSEPDKGMYDAMNKGIQISNGELIAFINADDWYEKDVITYVVSNYQKVPGADVIHGNEIRRSREGRLLWIRRPNQNYKNLIKGMTLFHPTCFITSKSYNQWGLYDIKYSLAADYELLLRFYLKGAYFCHVDKALANFRVGGLSWTKWNLLLHECKIIQIKYGLSPVAANINYIYKSTRYIIKILLVKLKLNWIVGFSFKRGKQL